MANTLNQAVLGELEQVITQLEANASLKGVVFASGKPGMFIAGADLNELATAPPGSEDVRRLVRRGLSVRG